MFKFLTPTPDAVTSPATIATGKIRSRIQQTSPLLATLLAATLLLSACQQPAAPTAEDSESQTSKQTLEQQRADANKPAPQSDSAAARIAQFQPLYVTEMQGLQRRLQAEYESLEAADASDSDSVSLATNPAVNTAASADGKIIEGNAIDGGANAATPQSTVQATDVDTDTNTDTNINTGTKATNANAANSKTAENAEINISTEVGERDLEVLKRISLEPREPELLNEEQIIKRYQQALQTLYEPAAEALSAQDSDTLLNIATLIPELFEHAEIAERVSVKSPALARLIIQHQVSQQIEVQQALDMQQMKVTQQQEFEGLMTKFNDTIKGYDEQIANYEETLKEFSDVKKKK